MCENSNGQRWVPGFYWLLRWLELDGQVPKNTWKLLFKWDARKAAEVKRFIGGKKLDLR